MVRICPAKRSLCSNVCSRSSCIWEGTDRKTVSTCSIGWRETFASANNFPRHCSCSTCAAVLSTIKIHRHPSAYAKTGRRAAPVWSGHPMPDTEIQIIHKIGSFSKVPVFPFWVSSVMRIRRMMLSHVSREGFCAAGFSDSKWDLLCYSFRLSLLYTIFLTNSTGKGRIRSEIPR